MSRSRRLVISVAIPSVGLAIVVMVVLARDQPTVDDRAGSVRQAAARTDPQESPEQLASLETRVARVEARLAEHGEQAAPASSSATADEGGEPSRSSQFGEGEIDQISILSNVVAEEPIDSEWASRQESTLREAVYSVDADAEVKAVTCASSLCRLVVQSRGGVGRDRLVHDISMTGPFANGGAYKTETLTDGTISVTAFSFRTGTTLRDFLPPPRRPHAP